jgi:hypothetical protein
MGVWVEKTGICGGIDALRVGWSEIDGWLNGC